VFGGGVDGRGQGACSYTGCSPDEHEEYGFREELNSDVASGSPEGASESDLGSSFEDGDDHDVGHPDRAD